jgi:hypothetical protein
MDVTLPSATAPYRGVRGWLLFFCVCLVVVRPAVGLFTSVALAAAGELAAAVVIFAITALGVYVGVGLWRVVPGAVERTKGFLWATLPAEVAVLFFTHQRYAFDGGDLREALSVLLFFGLWYSYLESSKRVQNTYRS